MNKLCESQRCKHHDIGKMTKFQWRSNLCHNYRVCIDINSNGKSERHYVCVTQYPDGIPEEWKIKGTIPRMKFTCHICKAKRDDDYIYVISTDISEEHELPKGTLIQNVRYCKDNGQCVEKAKIHRFII